jgi:hypothetical protein
MKIILTLLIKYSILFLTVVKEQGVASRPFAPLLGEDGTLGLGKEKSERTILLISLEGQSIMTWGVSVSLSFLDFSAFIPPSNTWSNPAGYPFLES